MRRFLLIMALLIAGAVALVLGLDIHRQLQGSLEEGFSGRVRSWVVAISPQTRGQVAFYRWSSAVLMGGGGLALLLGMLAAHERPGPDARADAGGKRKDRRDAEPRRGRKRKRN